MTDEARWQLVLHPDCERELLDLKRTNDDLLTKVIHDLRLLREFGLALLAEGRVKRLTPDVFEVRTRRASDINRVLFGVQRGPPGGAGGELREEDAADAAGIDRACGAAARGVERGRMSDWKTLEQFEEELRRDPALRAKLEAREPDYELAREVLAARLAAKMTQAELARAIGTSQSRVSRWERGEEAPRVEALRRIARATGRRLEVRFVA